MDKFYSKKLLEALVSLSSNEPFYKGDIKEAAKIIVKEISKNLSIDRASIWLFNSTRDCIILQQLYVTIEEAFYQDSRLYKKDCETYFSALEEDPIIVANDAETHPATSCFLEGYLKPLGVKSMLDVPIWFRGTLIGVICIESLTHREWLSEEVDFAQVLSSLYSFSYSVMESDSLFRELKTRDIEIKNRMTAINNSNAVIEFGLDRKVIYANKTFLEAMGYELEEIIEKPHCIFIEPGTEKTQEYEDFWKTLISGTYYSDIVRRVKKDGQEIFLQATYNPILDIEGNVYRVMKIAVDVTENFNQKKEIEKKNTYLEHAAKILRHDMHSGINTYMPRGLSSLERRLDEKSIKDLKIEAPLKMIKEGLRHTQKVYRGVYEFTNLVKKDVALNREDCDIKAILEDYLSATAYRPQVILNDLGIINVNEPLFCTAIDNLIRNGLKYNDSNTKIVKISREDNTIIVEDNGRGLTREEFNHLSQPYVRKEGQAEAGTGLGLNICIAILEEHGFSVDCEKLIEGGTKLTIKIN
jgi:PAS domain S-box-containing protein